MGGPLSEEEQIVVALRRIIRAISIHSQKLADEYGITVPQLLALQEAARIGEASPSALNRETHISRSTMTGILGRLEKRSLISRAPDPKDRRRMVVNVTDEGSALLERRPSLLQQRFHRELAALEKWEHSTLLAALQRIAAMMDVEELPAAPILSVDAEATKPRVQRPIRTRRPSSLRTCVNQQHA
jgi:DNA-binding MarR family transcriptional regulator